MKYFLTPFILSTLLLCSGLVSALDLKEAKQSGLVGEQRDGTLGIVGDSSADVAALVADINAKRAAAYSRIAAKNKTTVETVQSLAGKKAIERSATGQYVRPGGEWVQVK